MQFSLKQKRIFKTSFKKEHAAVPFIKKKEARLDCKNRALSICVRVRVLSNVRERVFVCPEVLSRIQMKRFPAAFSFLRTVSYSFPRFYMVSRTEPKFCAVLDGFENAFLI